MTIGVHRGGPAWMLAGLCAWALLGSAAAGWAKLNLAPESSGPTLDTIRGVVKATAEAVLASQIEGRISSLPFKDGQRFKKGDVLVLMDCAKYEAELAAATAEHEAKKKTYDNNRRLAQHQSIGHLELDVSQAETKKAAAAIRIAQVKVEGCRIKAPFAGRIVKLIAHEHENVFPNDQVLSILDDSRLEIELILPSKSLTWLKNGTAFTFAVDEIGHQYHARITEVGASVDAASQTIRAIGIFDHTAPDVLAGMSGSATFPAAAP